MGDGKEAKEFGKQFLERRSKWRAQKRGVVDDGNIDVPAKSVNASNEFQEVKVSHLLIYIRFKIRGYYFFLN